MHSENCKANHFGNSGSTGVSGAIEIFQRSESLHDLRYIKFLGDGDSRAYEAVNEIQPDGDTGIEKLECVGHVEEWMGTRLRTLKLKMKAIWATYFHKASTDAYLQHGLWPTSEDTLCGYSTAITTGEVYKHKNSLTSEVLDCIKDVYRKLSTPNLLAKCLHSRAMEAADRERLQKANYDILRNSKEARVKRRHRKCTLDTLAEERKNPSYEAGYARITGFCRIRPTNSEGVIVRSMGTTNPHRTWGHKSRLVGVIRKNS
ncbi:uncharacterized protein TNCV_361651 [Trichonephila clavipes]|nr:uncharacterized protein TNCV_361651 [Trichonephila clavipes]